MSNIAAMMNRLASAARAASQTLAASSHDQRNQGLAAMANGLRAHKQRILDANAKDMQAGREKGLSPALIDRLELSEKRIDAMASGIEIIAQQPDPLGRSLEQWHGQDNGLTLQRVAVPLGVIGIIYESRPNVGADAAALCLKSGNAVILRGGSESYHSSAAIITILQDALAEANLPREVVQSVPTTDRAAVGQLLTMTGLIDVIIPRGGKSLTERVANESRVPTLLHLDGNCHTYIHQDAHASMAKDIIVNAKMRRTGICGATETLLIDRSIAKAQLPAIAEALIAKGCELRGDDEARAIVPAMQAASEDDWATEYLDSILAVKVVSGLEDAIAHINRYGSHHTDAIVSANETATQRFTQGVDSAIVMVNSSTQFADGGEFGFGGEIGIATGRLHARGPVGARELTTYKTIVTSAGAVRAG